MIYGVSKTGAPYKSNSLKNIFRPHNSKLLFHKMYYVLVADYKEQLFH